MIAKTNIYWNGLGSSTTHLTENGYTMKGEKCRPRLKADDIYALAYKEVPKGEALECLNRCEKMTVTYTNCPSPHKTAVDAVNADATTSSKASESTDGSVNAVGHPSPLAKKTTEPSSSSTGSKPSPSNQPVRVPCSNHWKKHKQTDIDIRIDSGVTNGTPWVCKPR